MGKSRVGCSVPSGGAQEQAAAAAAKLLSLEDQSEDLSEDDLTKLKRMVLLSGAPRTMAVHVRAFERL